MAVSRLVLVGLSGTGKSTLATEVAARLGWQAVDLDADIEREVGRTIPEIFAQDGEPFFREAERAHLLRALASDGVVIATGGGAVANEAVWADDLLGEAATYVAWLDAAPETIAARLLAQADADGVKAARPLLSEGDPTAKIRAQREARIAFYRRADVALGVDGRAIAAIADDLSELVRLANGVPSEVTLTSTSSPSRIQVADGLRREVGTVIVQQWPKVRRVWLCVDANLRQHLGDDLIATLGLADLDVRVLEIPSGETSKSVDGLARIWDWALTEGADRSDVMVAVGGGVVGDLVGFAAATVLRGIGFVQVPTTLLAMVDSSVGGKTAINHPAGKNLIGAFYQPARVIVDTELLATLPEREFRSGWAEVIKHGVIEASTPGGEDGVLLDVLARNADKLLARTSPLVPWVVRRNISLKAAVVESDEREANLRAILNFGHTIGHGIEAAGYTMFHGEAIAVGTVAALRIAEAMGRIGDADVARIVALLEAFALPTTAAVDADEVRRHMAHDKKKASGKQLWVLPNAEGRIDIVRDLPEEAIQAGFDAVIRGAVGLAV